MLLILALVGITGCTAPQGQVGIAAIDSPPITIETRTHELLHLSDGYRAHVLVDGLVGPTQMIKGPDNQLWLAQYAGAEYEDTGQIIAVNLRTGDRQTLVEGLKKPTGLAILDNSLWIATERDLWRAVITENRTFGTLEHIMRDLPYDGRSNGTLTVTPGRNLLYETSGARFGGTPVDGSATLWQLDPMQPAKPVALATGLRNAYAHTYYGEDGLWFVDIERDLVNGQTPPDKLNFLRVQEGVPAPDYGWPKCYGNRQPAYNYGGDDAYCRGTAAPLALLESYSAPSSMVLSPWEEATLLIALSGTGEIIRVPIQPDGSVADPTMNIFVSGMRRPISLLVWDHNTLLIADHERGEIIAIEHEADG